MIIDSSKKIGIWGLGIVGISALKYFVQKGYQVQAMDQKELSAQQQSLLQELKVPFFLQKELNSFLSYNDYILPSCGIDLRPYSEYKHKFLSELDLFGAQCDTPIIAITGSVGKTTTTHLLSELIKAQGKKVFTGGNIGVGLLESIEHANAADYVVLEVSSFQLERCQTFAPDFAICTNIFANHLDRHGSMEEYIKAKLQITARQKSGLSLFPAAFAKAVSDTKSGATHFYFSCEEDVDSYPYEHNDASYYYYFPFYFLRNIRFRINYQTSGSEKYNFIEFRYHHDATNEVIFEFTNLPWVSYRENIIILASAMHMLGFSLDNFCNVLNEQEIPEHRMEKVATISNIDFYNDSKATIPASTLAAIEKINHRPIILFLGGISKGVNRAEFVRQLKDKVRLVYCFGKEAEQLKSFCDQNQITALAFANLELAFKDLSKNLIPQDQILFSPAGASYDLYADYRERGNHFKQLIHELNIKG